LKWEPQCCRDEDILIRDVAFGGGFGLFLCTNGINLGPKKFYEVVRG
jgi:hypothetical protein